MMNLFFWVQCWGRYLLEIDSTKPIFKTMTHVAFVIITMRTSSTSLQNVSEFRIIWEEFSPPWMNNITGNLIESLKSPRWLVSSMQNSNGPIHQTFTEMIFMWFGLMGRSAIPTTPLLKKSLGASVIDQFGQVIHSTGWCDAWGCSFKAELEALHCAVVSIGGTLTVCVDCKSLRNIFDEIRHLGSVPDNIAYKDLWVKIFQLCGFQEQCRINIRWVKAHQIDHNRGGGSQDQILNQVADVEARRQADLNSPVPKNFYESIKWHLNLERKWLCELSLLMSSTKDESIDGAGQTCDREVDLPESSQGKAVVELFPKWDWNKTLAINLQLVYVATRA